MNQAEAETLRAVIAGETASLHSKLDELTRLVAEAAKAQREDTRSLAQTLFTRLGELHDDINTLQRGTNEGFGSIHDRLDKLGKQQEHDGGRTHELEQSVNELAEGQRKLAGRVATKAGE